MSRAASLWRVGSGFALLASVAYTVGLLLRGPFVGPDDPAGLAVFLTDARLPRGFALLSLGSMADVLASVMLAIALDRATPAPGAHIAAWLRATARMSNLLMQGSLLFIGLLVAKLAEADSNLARRTADVLFTLPGVVPLLAFGALAGLAGSVWMSLSFRRRGVMHPLAQVAWSLQYVLLHLAGPGSFWCELVGAALLAVPAVSGWLRGPPSGAAR